MDMQEQNFLMDMASNGYTHLVKRDVPDIGPGTWCCISTEYIFTAAIKIGLTPHSFHRRYCYGSVQEAIGALERWDGKGHPPGEWIKVKGIYEGQVVNANNPHAFDDTILPVFVNKEDAEEWMQVRVDDECVDNHRFAFVDDDAAMSKYQEQKEGGCCGFFDREVIIGDRPAMIGCNYGH